MKDIPQQYQQAVDEALKELREIEASGELTVDRLALWMRKNAYHATYKWLAYGLGKADQREQ